MIGLNSAWQEMHPPVNVDGPNSLDAILQAANKRRDHLKNTEDELKATTEQLAQTTHRLYTDELTNVYNRNHFTDFKANVFDREQAHQKIAIIVIDFDGFKEINDTQGHVAGDKSLREGAAFFSNHFRTSDQIIQLATVVRTGGDEFIIICHNSNNNPHFEKELIEKMASLEKLPEKPINFSYGVAVFDMNKDDDLDSAQERADLAMYENKRMKQPLFKRLMMRVMSGFAHKKIKHE